MPYEDRFNLMELIINGRLEDKIELEKIINDYNPEYGAKIEKCDEIANKYTIYEVWVYKWISDEHLKTINEKFLKPNGKIRHLYIMFQLWREDLTNEERKYEALIRIENELRFNY
jgi:hypothetical protein